MLVAAVALLSLAPYMGASTELVRMRNALLLMEARDGAFTWTPESIPESFKLERGPVDPYFAAIADRLQLSAMPDDWARSLAISRHLLGSSPPLKGEAIMSDLRGTYRRIVENGDGYCGDFVDVFVGIALAAGIPVRTWAFSFDGFGGHGHIWPEIWNRQLGRWQLVDIFNNYYFFETVGVPLSALELRLVMLSGTKLPTLAALHPGARPGWTKEDKAWDYYRRGLPQWYLWWGNNVHSYDNTWLVRLLGRAPRAVEQLGAIAVGVAPGLVILPDTANRSAQAALRRLRWHLIVVALTLPLASLAAALCWLQLPRRTTPAIAVDRHG
jgi:hypothetical protein